MAKFAREMEVYVVSGNTLGITFSKKFVELLSIKRGDRFIPDVIRSKIKMEDPIMGKSKDGVNRELVLRFRRNKTGKTILLFDEIEDDDNDE